MKKNRTFVYKGFRVRIRKLLPENEYRVKLFPIGFGYGPGYRAIDMNIIEVEQMVKDKIDSGVWDSYLNQPKPFTEDEETMIEGEFDELIERLTDEQFWEYIKTWYTTDELFSMMANWNTRMKNEEIPVLKCILGEEK